MMKRLFSLLIPLLLMLTGCQKEQVTITMPASSFNLYQEAELNDLANEQGYSSITYFEDQQTVTFTMAKDDYDLFLASLSSTIEDILLELVEDDNLAFASIEHNEQFDVFNCTMDGNSLGINDHYSIPALYYYALVYNNFCSIDPVTIRINYLNPQGDIIYEVNDTLSYNEWLSAYYLN